MSTFRIFCQTFIGGGVIRVFTEAGCDGNIHAIRTTLTNVVQKPEERFMVISRCCCKTDFSDSGSFEWEPPPEYELATEEISVNCEDGGPEKSA